MKYVLCKECKGYYVLQEGESINNFGNCRCGGELEYVETHSENLDKNQDRDCATKDSLEIPKLK